MNNGGYMTIKRLTIELTEEMHQDFKVAVASLGTTMKDVLTERIKEVIKEAEEKQKEKLQSK